MLKKRLFRFLKWFFGIVLSLMLIISGILYFFKDEIIAKFVEEINSHLKAKVEVSKVDIAFWGSFPNLSVDFHHVFVPDSYPNATKLDTLLYTDRIRLKLNPMDIWREDYTVKSIEVSPGTLKLKVNNEGVTNYDILKETNDSTASTGFDLNLNSIEFADFRVSYRNKATDQVYRTYLKEMELTGALSSRVFTTKATSKLAILEARSGNVTLIRNQPASLSIQVNVNQDSNSVTIPPSVIYVAGLPFNFNGNVNSDNYDFHLDANNISIADAANSFSLRQSQDVKNFEGTGKVLFDLDIDGKNESTSPTQVDCAFGIESGSLKDPTSGVRIRQLKLDGKYSNRGGKKKEFLELKNISFTSPGGPFAGNILLTQFDTPRLEGDANGSIDLGFVQSLVAVPAIHQVQGMVDLQTDFLVTTIVNEDESVVHNIDRCEGQVNLSNVALQLVDDKRIFSDMNGQMYLRNNEAGMDDLSLRINNSDFMLDGVFKNIIDYFRGTGDLQSNISIVSNRIDIEDLGTESKADKMDQPRSFILPKTIFGEVDLEVKQLNYSGHKFENLEGNMSVNNRIIHFPRIAVRNGGADVRGSITIDERSPEYFYLTSQLVSKNINFKPLFAEWDNFRQDVIKSENIHGIAQANVSFEAPFDLRTGIISKGIKSTIGLQIDDGRLTNVSTFKSITESLRTSSIKTILGKQNINTFEQKLLDLRFDRLTNTLIIKNGVLTIPSMSISSSALDVEVSGQHTFDNEIDYRFGFRFRDLKRQESSEFGEVVDDGTGLRIFMRMYGTIDDPIIEWDKQSRKEQAKENREEAKQDAKSILKSEFGLFKNDTTVKTYIQDRTPKEELILEFNPVDSIDQILDESKPKKKDSRLGRALEKMKRQAEIEKKEAEEEFIID